MTQIRLFQMIFYPLTFSLITIVKWLKLYSLLMMQEILILCSCSLNPLKNHWTCFTNTCKLWVTQHPGEGVYVSGKPKDTCRGHGTMSRNSRKYLRAKNKVQNPRLSRTLNSFINDRWKNYFLISQAFKRRGDRTTDFSDPLLSGLTVSSSSEHHLKPFFAMTVATV